MWARGDWLLCISFGSGCLKFVSIVLLSRFVGGQIGIGWYQATRIYEGLE